jgi:predicted GH43/DUF377 family glycosyl hydrolase
MIERLEPKILPDPQEVILQFFELNAVRTKRVINKIFSLDDNEVSKILIEVFRSFSKRHKYFEEGVYSNYQKVVKYIPSSTSISNDRKLLLGAYFSKEYSICSAALFNPSIVPHPDQSGLEKDSLRFVLSLRATGEGHISSIRFREGVIDKNSNVHMKQKSVYSCLPQVTKQSNEIILNRKLKCTGQSEQEIKDLLDSNYTCEFPEEVELSERILFPSSASESMGMEDARFVRFTDDDKLTYYGTYTAYNGRTFRPQLIETENFRTFIIGTLHGNSISDKGMALFPRKIKNKYVITSRQDSESIFLMFSDDLYCWNDEIRIKLPEQPWEYIQIGNCGSPIETEEGWILITHAVGPVRTYVISAMLLDLDDPTKVIGSLKKPLILPNKEEREGYVPNVVYSCGSIAHDNNLIIPYAFSDSACGFGRIKISELLNMFRS